MIFSISFIFRWVFWDTKRSRSPGDVLAIELIPTGRVHEKFPFELQVQNVTDQNAPKNYNFERLFIINYFESKSLHPVNKTRHIKATLPKNRRWHTKAPHPRNRTRRPNLQFIPLFWKRQLEITSQHSYPTLVLACLNLLCLWMNVDIISTINTHLPKICALFLVFYTGVYSLLHKLKTILDPF